MLAGALIFVSQKLYAERRKVFLELESKNNSIISSINYAKRIQNSTLPARNLFSLFLPESFIFCKPKDIVSGDFYWLEAGGEKVFFAVADCTGHGVPGAMMSVMCSNLLTKAVMEMNLQEPNEILDKAVELLEDTFVKSSEDVKDGMDITLCSYDIRKKELKYAGAYGALNLINKNGLQVIKGDRQPVGSHHFRKPFTNHVIQTEEGDCVYLTSDGFADQFGGPKEKKFMVKAFRLLLLDINKKPMQEQASILNETFGNWKGDLPQIEDVCVMGVRF
ncbi:MAG: serine phosphatase RsbU (regulator of sigma subunit) [Flammeovirgaceae bacterium]